MLAGEEDGKFLQVSMYYISPVVFFMQIHGSTVVMMCLVYDFHLFMAYLIFTSLLFLKCST